MTFCGKQGQQGETRYSNIYVRSHGDLYSKQRMPFSLLVQGFPTTDIPAAQAQGPAVQGMFLHLLEQVDPAVSARLHQEDRYRPYTLSPLSLANNNGTFQGFRLPRARLITTKTPCAIRITFLEDTLFPTFSRYFLERPTPTFRLGDTQFAVTGVLTQPQTSSARAVEWSQYLSYADLINRASHTSRKITLRFLTPTSFRRGRVDFPLPDPRLVFRSYQKRFEEFYQVGFLPDFADQVEYHTGIASLDRVQTELIKTKRVALPGFIGRVTYQLARNAPPDLVFQMNLLADYAFFCGTGRKTAVGMGQTSRQRMQRMDS